MPNGLINPEGYCTLMPVYCGTFAPKSKIA
jgi:hypothetical protein